MSYLVLCGTRATALFDREKVRQSAPELTQLGGHVQVLDVDKGGYDLLLWVHPPDGHDFQVMRDVEGGSLSTDATAQQVAAVGAWTAQVADFPTTARSGSSTGTRHVVLHAGTTAQSVASSWRPLP